jgi:hypothetical protein
MNVFKTLPRLAGLLAALGAAVAALAASSTAAMAMQVPPFVGGPVTRTQPAQPARHPAAVPPGGMPGWELGLIVAGIVIALCVVALLAYRAWSARRRLTSTAQAAQQPELVRRDLAR